MGVPLERFFGYASTMLQLNSLKLCSAALFVDVLYRKT